MEIAGLEGLPVYKTLKGKENVNEFLIAEKLKLTINQIRNVLYKFDAYNLVASTRKKDRKKGWYIYFWTFLEERAKDVVVLLKKRRIKQFELRLEKENAHQFYLCINRCTRVSLENAMENQFMCLECGQLMIPDDNTKTINRITKEMADLQMDVDKLEEPEKIQKKNSENPKIRIIPAKAESSMKKVELALVVASKKKKR